MTCPICRKRRGKRLCPAKAASICSVCCGTEREVTIDCPPECAFLAASREYDWQRRTEDRSKIPFAETQIPASFVEAQRGLIGALSYAVLAAAREERSLVDSDILASLRSLAETYRTLSSGLYYESPPAYVLQRVLYERLKSAAQEFRRSQSQRAGFTQIRDGEIRDALIFLAQVAALRANNRPRGRAFIDFLRGQFAAQESSPQATNVLLMP